MKQLNIIIKKKKTKMMNEETKWKIYKNMWLRIVFLLPRTCFSLATSDAF